MQRRDESAVRAQSGLLGQRLVGDRGMDRRGADQPTGVEVLDRLEDLRLGVHDEWAVPGPPPAGYLDLLEELAALPVEDVLQWRPGQDYPRPVAAALLLSVQAAEAGCS